MRLQRPRSTRPPISTTSKAPGSAVCSSMRSSARSGTSLNSRRRRRSSEGASERGLSPNSRTHWSTRSDRTESGYWLWHTRKDVPSTGAVAADHGRANQGLVRTGASAGRTAPPLPPMLPRSLLVLPSMLLLGGEEE